MSDSNTSSSDTPVPKRKPSRRSIKLVAAPPLPENFHLDDGRKFRFATHSLGCIPESSAFRIGCVKLCTHKLFDAVILATILMNSVILAFTDCEYVEILYIPKVALMGVFTFLLA